MTVVVPPKAADVVALSKLPALRSPAPDICSMRACESTPPGVTIRPAASISVMPVSRCSPIAAMSRLGCRYPPVRRLPGELESHHEWLLKIVDRSLRHLSPRRRCQRSELPDERDPQTPVKVSNIIPESEHLQFFVLHPRSLRFPTF